MIDLSTVQKVHRRTARHLILLDSGVPKGNQSGLLSTQQKHDLSKRFHSDSFWFSGGLLHCSQMQTTAKPRKEKHTTVQKLYTFTIPNFVLKSRNVFLVSHSFVKKLSKKFKRSGGIFGNN